MLRAFKGYNKGQLKALFEDIYPKGVKNWYGVKPRDYFEIAENLKKYNPEIVVVDPVMISKKWILTFKTKAKENLIKYLIPMAYLVTPNVPEAEEITGIKIENVEDMKKRVKKY